MATKKLPKKTSPLKKISVESYDERNRMTLREGDFPANFDSKLKKVYTITVEAELVESGIGTYGEQKGKKYHTFAINKSKLQK